MSALSIRWRLRRSWLLTATASAVAVLVVYRFLVYPSAVLPRLGGAGADHFSVNSTLGFGSIYVVSAESSPRRHNLLQAANITELDFTIPLQPKWTEADLAKYPVMGKGSLQAWLGHLHVLQL
jgi:hypothetical protein